MKPNINLLNAIVFIDKAWKRVTDATIQHSFHNGLSSRRNNEQIEFPMESESQFNDIVEHYDLDLFIDIDNELVTSGHMSESDIVNLVADNIATLDDEDDDEIIDEEEQKQVPTASDALKAIKTISKFYENRQSDFKILNHVSKIEENVEKFYLNEYKVQKKITDYM